MATQLWVGSFTHGEQPGLRWFEVNDTTLRPAGSLEVTDPGWLVEGDDEIWAGLHLDESSLVRIVLDPVSVGESVSTGDADACHVALSPDAAWAALAHYTSGSIAIVGTGAEGGGPRLVEQRRFTGHSGVDAARQEAPHAHHVAWLTNTWLLVCDLGADLVRSLVWDEGVLSELDPIVLPPGFGPRHLVVREVGEGVNAMRQIAVAGELSGQVAAFELGVDARVGWRQTAVVDGSLVGGGVPSGIRLLADDQVVLANRMINTLAVLDWVDDGSLVLVDEFDSGGDHPRDIVVHDGRLWVAHLGSHEVTVLGETSRGWRVLDRTEVPSPAALCFREVVDG
ncbi:lactonase family protein [Aestuariimicrobium ganziense]|uniref:lactonase family protein n=1 Tax=Aestuariimicrobium ganziense TaxID=2773677 RepID=UPI0019408E14|nr:beta-propeller fold lactonase family protein [Aestuariimicrobium ganziense]